MDVNQLFAAAEAAFATKDYARARTLVGRAQQAAGDHEAILHLSALIERRSGNPLAAERAFARALRLAPRDAQINNNYANLLDELGRPDAALLHYDRAVAADHRFVEGRLNRALALQRLGRLDEALRDLDAVATMVPPSSVAYVRAHSARGSVLRRMSRTAEAAAAYDAALAAAPTHAKALDGRARVALEAGEPGATARFRAALAARADDPTLVLGMAEAMEAEGHGGALDYLAEAVDARPGWIEGQARLAEMRSEQGDPGDFARGYVQALGRDPTDRALHYGHWRALALGGRYRDALDAMKDARQLADDPDMRLMRAVFLGEAGEPEAALAALRTLGDGSDVRMARARALLRLGDAGGAARDLEQVVDADIGNIAAWAHLGLAWRLTGDARHDWLCGRPGIYGTLDLGLDAATLDALVPLLRALHRTSAHPIGQSLRGGTQTRGRLLRRREPELVRLAQAIKDALTRFMDALPPRDDAHPLLRHRDHPVAITGSWSVRLTRSGFHVNHIHPEGVLSSACYIALPPGMSGVGTDGWLEVGAPPVELGLSLTPLATIEPRPGRLALFPSYLYHGTRPFASGERLTVAFDVNPT